MSAVSYRQGWKIYHDIFRNSKISECRKYHDIFDMLAELYYVMFALWHEPSVCVCRLRRCYAIPRGL